MQIEKRNKTDRRIQRTRQALRTALHELIREKEYDAISTEEITERANVGRATFYLHYKDKEDLLLEEFNEMANERVQVLSQIPFSAWFPLEDAENARTDPPRPLLMVFQHIHENSRIYYILLKSARSSRIVERIRKISTGAITNFMEAKLKTEPLPISLNMPIDFFAAYFSGALLSTVDWWLEEGMHHSPEEVTKMFRRLFFRGARDSIGFAPNADQ